MEEEWRDIPQFSRYMVSNLGHVKAKPLEFTDSKNRHVHLKERFLKQSTTIGHKNGGVFYTKVKLVRDDNVIVNMNVHRLVALAFIPNPENKPEVNHIDLDKSNNRVDNLEWVTKIENMNRCILKPHSGDTNGNSKLPNESIPKIFEWYADLGTCVAVAKKVYEFYGISITREQISNIIKKRQRNK